MESTWEGEPVFHMTTSHLKKRQRHSSEKVSAFTDTEPNEPQAPTKSLASKKQAALRTIVLTKRRRVAAAATQSQSRVAGGQRLGPILGGFAASAGTVEPHLANFSRQVCAAMTLSGAARKRAMHSALMAFEDSVTQWLSPAAQPERSATRLSAAASKMAGNKRMAGRDSSMREERFMQKLHAALRALAPSQRRQALAEDLTQCQRQRLERWMRNHSRDGVDRTCCNNKESSTVSRTSRRSRINSVPRADRGDACIAGYLIARGKLGYRAVVHLEHGLAAVTRVTAWSVAEAAASLADLVALRVKWRLSDKAALPPTTAPGRYFFQATAAVAAVRFAGPIRKTLGDAANDWHELRSSVGAALITRGSLKAGYTPEALQAQWDRTSRAWMAIWREQGRCNQRLHQLLTSKEKVATEVQQRAARQWQGMQSRLRDRLTRLLQSDKAGWQKDL